MNQLLARLLAVSLGLAMLLMSVTVLLQVYFRYIARASLPWSEELSRYLLVYLSFAGGALAYYRDAHVSLELFKLRAQATGQAALDSFIAAAVMLLGSTLLLSGIEMVGRNRGQRSPAMGIPMAWPNAAIALAGGLLLIFALEKLGRALTKKPAAALLWPLMLFWLLLATAVWGHGLAAGAEGLLPWLLQRAASWTELLAIPWLILLLFGLLLISGLPIAFVIALTALLAMLAGGSRLLLLPSRMFAGTDTFPLLAVPLFVLAGALMNTGGITKRLVAFASGLVGWMRGGLALVNIQASMFFAGISGSAVADASAVGGVLIPAMEEEGYDRDFAAAVTAASSTVGPIIPPSIPMVLYGILSPLPVSVGALFLAGAVPGVLLGVSMMLLSYVIARRRNYPARPWQGFKQLGRSFLQAFWALLMPLIILGGILSGIFTATEASAVAVAYAFIAGGFIYRSLRWRALPSTLVDTAVVTSLIMFVVAAAQPLAFVFARERIPQLVADALLSVGPSLWLLLPLVNLLLLLVGTFLETTAALIIFIPILVPLMANAGVEPLWFGVIMVLNLVIGMVTPPVGVVLFVTSGIAKLTFERLVAAIWPYLLVMLLVLVLVSAFPILSLGLPRLFGY